MLRQALFAAVLLLSPFATASNTTVDTAMGGAVGSAIGGAMSQQTSGRQGTATGAAAGADSGVLRAPGKWDLVTRPVIVQQVVIPAPRIERQCPPELTRQGRC